MIQKKETNQKIRSLWSGKTGRVTIGMALLCAVVLVGCKQKVVPQQQIPPVKTVTITPETIVLNTELPGRTSAYRIAEIRPQVSGVILKRLFTEGSDVKEGDSLYQIDPAPFEAVLNRAKAGQARSEASLPSAQLRMARYKEALAAQAVSQQDFDDAKSSVDQIQADIDYYKAEVQTAEINLTYSKVISPISGRIGTSSVTDGAVVTAYSATPLATVQQLDPIYVDVPQSTSEMLRLKKLLQEGLLQHDEDTINLVNLIQDDGSLYKHQGTFQFRDVTVDPTTSTMTLRMIFPNPDGELLPGMFVRTIVEEGTSNALLLPQEAVVRDRKGNPYVWIVDDNKIARKDVELDRAVGNKWLLKTGLTEKEHVVVEGFQGFRSVGTPVQETYLGDAKNMVQAFQQAHQQAQQQVTRQPSEKAEQQQAPEAKDTSQAPEATDKAASQK